LPKWRVKVLLEKFWLLINNWVYILEVGPYVRWPYYGLVLEILSFWNKSLGKFLIDRPFDHLHDLKYFISNWFIHLNFSFYSKKITLIVKKYIIKE
jgi:hypothetical protein